MNIIDKLPKRFRYTIHNVIAHPISEILYQAGLKELANKVHDSTLPSEKDNHDND